MAYRLTLLGRSLLLLTSELLANLICWIVATMLFARSKDTYPILSLALLAWTLGLRHALDADHISAIDNATRGLIGLGRAPVTCGLFFSLGHSTIVIVVTIAIAISSDVYQRINNISDVGGIIGAAVSGAFLFIIAVANAIILWKILKRRRKEKNSNRCATNGEDTACPSDEEPRSSQHNHMFMMRIIGPVINFVNRPWKMYPVGVLFGLGFDTASSVALIAVSALARKTSNGSSIPSSNVIILPLLFTAGMTLVDSADSVLVLYSYTGFIQTSSWALVTKVTSRSQSPLSDSTSDIEHCAVENIPCSGNQIKAKRASEDTKGGVLNIATEDTTNKRDEHHVDTTNSGSMPAPLDTNRKMNVISTLSIVLTLMSILVAFSISLITIMGLIGEQCSRCTAAAEAEDGGGLAGSWWRAWARANDNSGYIGIAIVGMFVVLAAGWFVCKWFKGGMQSIDEGR
ncbi:hypothetical protein AMATHDRAFT_136484 [Amanita thiersii Skay4041]|uniref:Nickel/cobalt efflux system n=1 Tax=Amanita thiersii Skay4041 TaxID=703135 RepID=A0A2A9NT00_9AGAR|nr:hypothetical protein AMATHDRAFT_136484 [Amanita thiersii Skay4041]